MLKKRIQLWDEEMSRSNLKLAIRDPLLLFFRFSPCFRVFFAHRMVP